MIRKLFSFIKILIFLAILYVTYLYYTRPEMIIPANTFKNTLAKNGYNVKSVKYQDTSIAYEATKGEIKIIYAGFSSDDAAQEFYAKLTDRYKDSKYSVKISRDFRIGKPSAEKQSFVYDHIFHIAIYAKNAVIYTDSFTKYSNEIDELYKDLFVPVKFDLMETFQQMKH